MKTDWNKRWAYGNPPCKGCEKRSAGCHGRCGEYKEWKEKSEIIRHKINMDTMAENYRQSQVVKYKYMKWQENRRR